MPFMKNKRTGEVIEVDAGGRPVSRPPADPAFPYAGPKAEADVENTRAGAGRTRVQTQGDTIDNQTKAATQPFVIAKAKNDAISSANAARGVTPEIAQQNKAKTTALRNLDSVVEDLTNQYYANFRGNGGSNKRGGGVLGSVMESLPGRLRVPFGGGYSLPGNSTNDKFNSTALRAGPFIQSILGLTGKEADAAAEYERKVMPFIPSASEADETQASKIKQMRKFLDEQMRQQGMTKPARGKIAPPRKAASNTIDFEKWGR